MVPAMTSNEFDNALRGLCLAVANFTYISREIFVNKPKRRETLKQYAQELQKASELFLKVCDDESGVTRTRNPL